MLAGGAGATGLARPFCIGGGGGAGARDAADGIAGFGGIDEPGKGFAAGGFRYQKSYYDRCTGRQGLQR